MNKFLISDPSAPSNQEHRVCNSWEDVLFEIPMDDETPPTPDNPVQITDGDVLLTITALQ